uniref:Uncharacterized protein n=1 Tax=Oryza rufipogon TaxID=4529 RepID=A0A0E0MVR3_ORYRU
MAVAAALETSHHGCDQGQQRRRQLPSPPARMASSIAAAAATAGSSPLIADGVEDIDGSSGSLALPCGWR